MGAGVEVGGLLRERLGCFEGYSNGRREAVALLGVWRWEDISWVAFLWVSCLPDLTSEWTGYTGDGRPA